MKTPTLKGFLKFCNDPANRDREFTYMDTKNCAVCQYIKSLGGTRPHAGGDHVDCDQGRWKFGDAYAPEGDVQRRLVLAISDSGGTFGGIVKKYNAYKVDHQR